VRHAPGPDRGIPFAMYPDFLCIGAQKAGTTWLYRNLQGHPEAWLPPIKELHFFNDLRRHAPPGPLGRVRRRRWRRHLLHRMKGQLRHPSPRMLGWDVRFLLGDWSDEWYGAIFEHAGERLAGDITPAYSILTAEEVAHVHSLMPNARVIFILRDPVERAWSHAVMDRAKRTRRTVAQVPVEEYIEHFHSRASRLRGDYFRTLENWQPFREQDRMRVHFFDDVRGRPVALLGEICAFLGLSEAPARFEGTAARRVNAADHPGTPIPRRCRSELIGIYGDDLERLAREFGGAAERWAARAG